MSKNTLLIGLGGAGGYILNQIYALTTPDQRKNITFAVLDVNEQAIQDIPEYYTVHKILFSVRNKEALAVNSNAPASDLFVSENSTSTRNEYRTAFISAMEREKLTPLDDAIEELYCVPEDVSKYAPQVIVVGTLCTRFGSALSLPLCMYIRNYLKTMSHQKDAVINGFFMRPEIYYSDITADDTRLNMQENASLAVDEIDSYVMKRKPVPPEKSDLQFMLSPDGSDSRPMDLCFLFDGQSLDGMKLRSANDYFRHVTNCIFNRFITPALSGSMPSGGTGTGSGCFASLGTSQMIYPKDTVKRYLALSLADKKILREWATIDELFLKKYKQYLKQARSGEDLPPVNRDEAFVRIADESVLQNELFVKTIRNMCMVSENKKTSPRSKLYLQSLKAYIEEEVKEEKYQFAEDIELGKRLREKLNASYAKLLKTQGQDLVKQLKDLFTSLQQYRDAVVIAVTDLSRRLIFRLFQDNDDFSNTEDEFRLEYWLQQEPGTGVFIHPLAICYILNQLIKETRDAVPLIREDADSELSRIRCFDETIFDDPETKDKVETLPEYAKNSSFLTSGIRRLQQMGNISENIGALKEKFDQVIEDIDQYWQNGVTFKVYEYAFRFFTRMASGYVSFFDALLVRHDSFADDLARIEKNAESDFPIRFVCADESCLKKAACEVLDSDMAPDVPASAYTNVYSSLRQYETDLLAKELDKNASKEKLPEAIAKEAERAEEGFTSHLFDNTVIPCIESHLDSQCGDLFRMDALAALKKEASYVIPEADANEDHIAVYCNNVLSGVLRMARPFIRIAAGQTKQTVNSCVAGKETVESGQSLPEWKKFFDRCQADKTITYADQDSNVIRFFQTVYVKDAAD